MHRFDARYGQMTAQTSLLLLIMVWFDFGPSPAQAAIYLATALAMDRGHAWLTSSAANWRSTVSTGLSLGLLLRSHDPWVWLIAPVLAMGGKFLIRINGKHLFNPSAFAIVLLLLSSDRVWVSPGQWGTTIWLGAFALSAGCLILARVARLDLAAAFLGFHMSLLLFRAWWLGDPLAIPLHQIQSGSLLIFALFMLTDPRSTPDSRYGRLIFAAAVAGFAHWLIFHWQIREGLLYALVTVSCTTPLIDRFWPASRFTWPKGV